MSLSSSGKNFRRASLIRVMKSAMVIKPYRFAAREPIPGSDLMLTVSLILLPAR